MGWPRKQARHIPSPATACLAGIRRPVRLKCGAQIISFVIGILSDLETEAVCASPASQSQFQVELLGFGLAKFFRQFVHFDQR